MAVTIEERVPTQDGYDRWAGVYDEEDNPLIALEERFLPPLLGGLRGLSVLELGCGTGRVTLRMAAEGARVTALDFSTGMLSAARSKPGAAAIEFLQHDLLQPLPFERASFDLVTSFLVLEHVERLGPFFEEAFRVCRTGGAAVLSAMHPALMLRGTQARFTDPRTGTKVYPRSYANQLSDMVMAAVRAGFRLEALQEHAVDEALVAQSPRAQRYLGWPMLVLMKLLAVSC